MAAARAHAEIASPRSLGVHLAALHTRGSRAHRRARACISAQRRCDSRAAAAAARTALLRIWRKQRCASRHRACACVAKLIGNKRRRRRDQRNGGEAWQSKKIKLRKWRRLAHLAACGGSDGERNIGEESAL